MKLKRFNEADKLVNISNERVEEIIDDLSLISDEIDSKSKDINKILNELEGYKSLSKKSNNQIDESVLNLDLIRVKLDESTSLIDNIRILLKSYQEGGSEFIY